MKKILILLLSITMFTACSDDDDASSEGNIVGTWMLVEANNVPGFTLDDCTGRSTITFNEDNSATSNFSSYVGDACLSIEEEGNWSSSSNSRYTIEIPGFDDPVTGTITFSNANRFTFRPDVLTGTNLVFERN